MLKIKDDVYFVGAFNPNLRVFDIIMKTEYGTTYNAYLLRGEKTALVETVHDSFKNVLLENIEEICPVNEIDYIVMNHTEPDHSGSIAEILNHNPDVTVVASAAGIKNIGNIVGHDFKFQTVKSGDSIDLGKGMVMEFITAPNLHWPDSIFTYVPGREIVFTCDFLGAHYCEPRVFDSCITYGPSYEYGFTGYYNAIFGPFKKFVLAGLDKLENLKFDTACTSHGPILQDKLKWAIDKYREWSQPVSISKTASVFYVSAYGYTQKLAKSFEEELNSLGIKAKAYNIIETEPSVIAQAIETSAGLMFGSPTINRDALKPVWDVISSIDAVTNSGKPFVVFGSYGWGGEACQALEQRLTKLGLKPASEYLRVNFKPKKDDMEKVKGIAKQFADML